MTTRDTEAAKPPVTLGTIEQAAEKIRGASSILITCHRGPDGDSVGSMVALAALLRANGKKATLYTPDLVPRNLKWLPLTRSVQRRLPKTARFDLTVVVDCGDPQLLGPKFPPPRITGELVALDHHASGRPFGDLFVCDPGAASVGVMVARIARVLGWTITDDAAKGIFVSIVADTGSFRYANTNAEALRLAGDFVDSGAVDPWQVSERVSEQASAPGYKLLAAVLGTLQLALDGKVALLTVTAEMVKQAEASWEDTNGMVNYARALKGVECGVLMSPAKHGGIRVSMRSKGHEIDAGQVCHALGGGGHPGAAGCTIPGDDLGAARTTVLQALADVLGVPLDEADIADPAETPPDADASAPAADSAPAGSASTGEVEETA